MVIHAREISPTLITSDLYQSLEQMAFYFHVKTQFLLKEVKINPKFNSKETFTNTHSTNHDAENEPPESQDGNE